MKIVEPDNLYVPDIGDVLWGAGADWSAPEPGEPISIERRAALSLNVLDGTEFDNEILLTSNVRAHSIKVMAAMGLDTKWFFPYRDGYTGFKVYGIMPVAVLSDNISKYKEQLKLSDYALDNEWTKHNAELVPKSYNKPAYMDIFELTKVQKHLMGTGFTYVCSGYDGSNSCIPAKMKLDNGDWLFVWFWEWYNK